jgi:hypothetical protein
MSVSNLAFLDKPNFCYVCARLLDNKKMEEIILQCIRYENEDYRPMQKPSDPVILNEDIQFCNYEHYWVYVCKEHEMTPEELLVQKQKEFDRWWKSLTTEEAEK